MDLGMPALLELDGAEPCAALCRELRLRFIELNLNLPAYQPGEADVPSLRSIAEKYGIYYTIHMDENLNPWDFNPRVAEAYRQAAEEAIGLAKALELLLESPAFGLTLDAGHSHAAGGVDEPLMISDRLRHMHLHDARGRRDHLALGTGEVDWPKYLSLAEERHCRVVLETKTAAALRQSADALRAAGELT